MNRRRKLIGALGLTVAIAAGAWYWNSKRIPETKYRDVKVERASIENSILSTGSVQPENRLEIKSPIAGRVERVLVQEGQAVYKGQILAWMSSTERAALLDAARSEGKEELQRWEKMYRPTPVVAPIKGTVILRNVEPGQTFTGTDAILVMSDRLTVKALVDETDIAQIKLRQKAEIILDAYSREHIPAHVDQVAFEAKTVNNVTTYTVDVLPDKTPDYMRAGMTANVSFNIDERINVLTVPAEAVMTEDGQTSVTVRGPDGKPTLKKVEAGLSDGKLTEIKSGLSEGETVLVAEFVAKEKRSGSNPFSPMGNRSSKSSSRSRK
jgi:macrolide-specific efflux system membrane fusion protein